jgi:hypothetical protein
MYLCNMSVRAIQRIPACLIENVTIAPSSIFAQIHDSPIHELRVLFEFPDHLPKSYGNVTPSAYLALTQGGVPVNQFIRMLLLSLTAITAFVIEDSYVSNAEREIIRHPHIDRFLR